MRILYVCTANVCRSPAAQQVMALELARRMRAYRPAADETTSSPASAAVRELLVRIELASAGVMAVAGWPGCPRAPALALGAGAQHRSARLTPELAAASDLILTAERAHSSWVAGLLPGATSRTFTIRQAGRLAQWVAGPQGPLGAKPPVRPAEIVGAHVAASHRREPLPPMGDPDGRLLWFVHELDAARRGSPGDNPGGAPATGAVPAPTARPRAGRIRGWRSRGSAHRGRPGTPTGPAPADAGGGHHEHPDDILDPHIHGYELHQQAHEQIVVATVQLADALVQLALA